MSRTLHIDGEGALCTLARLVSALITEFGVVEASRPGEARALVGIGRSEQR